MQRVNYGPDILAGLAQEKANAVRKAEIESERQNARQLAEEERARQAELNLGGMLGGGLTQLLPELGSALSKGNFSQDWAKNLGTMDWGKIGKGGTYGALQPKTGFGSGISTKDFITGAAGASQGIRAEEAAIEKAIQDLSEKNEVSLEQPMTPGTETVTVRTGEKPDLTKIGNNPRLTSITVKYPGDPTEYPIEPNELEEKRTATKTNTGGDLEIVARTYAQQVPDASYHTINAGGKKVWVKQRRPWQLDIAKENPELAAALMRGSNF